MKKKISDEDNKTSTLSFPDIELTRQLFGQHNVYLKRISDAADVSIDARGNTVFIHGDRIGVELAENILNQLYTLLKEKVPIFSDDGDNAIRILSSDHHAELKALFMDKVCITSKKRFITPKSPNQKEYIEAIRSFDIVFGIGPAGTGKTYLAMAMAVSEL